MSVILTLQHSRNIPKYSSREFIYSVSDNISDFSKFTSELYTIIDDRCVAGDKVNLIIMNPNLYRRAISTGYNTFETSLESVENLLDIYEKIVTSNEPSFLGGTTIKINVTSIPSGSGKSTPVLNLAQDKEQNSVLFKSIIRMICVVLEL